MIWTRYSLAEIIYREMAAAEIVRATCPVKCISVTDCEGFYGAITEKKISMTDWRLPLEAAILRQSLKEVSIKGFSHSGKTGIEQRLEAFLRAALSNASLEILDFASQKGDAGAGRVSKGIVSALSEAVQRSGNRLSVLRMGDNGAWPEGIAEPLVAAAAVNVGGL